jgi:hypothetical protein
MVQHICPYCRCEDSFGRETNASRPYSYLDPTPTEVYAAVFEVYSRDRSVLVVNRFREATLDHKEGRGS